MPCFLSSHDAPPLPQDVALIHGLDFGYSGETKMTAVTTDAPPMPIWNGQRSEGWGSRAMGAVSASAPSSFGAASPFNGFIGSGQQQLSTGSQPQWPALQDAEISMVARATDLPAVDALAAFIRDRMTYRKNR